ncbi:MAG: hypothetical protein ACK4Q5_08345 [Saprospiraceae bacterium]
MTATPALQLPLTNVQMELMKVFAYQVNEDELHELRLMLGRFFAERSIQLANQIWDERGLTDGDMEKWLEEES